MTDLIGFVSVAGLPPRERVGVFAGADAQAAAALAGSITGADVHLIVGPHADRAVLTLVPEGVTVVEHDDERVIPLGLHWFHGLFVLPGAIGGPVSLPYSLSEIRRLLHPEGSILIVTGELARGVGEPEDHDRITVPELQRSLLRLQLVIVKIRLETPPVRLTRTDHRAALSQLGVRGAWVLAKNP